MSSTHAARRSQATSVQREALRVLYVNTQGEWGGIERFLSVCIPAHTSAVRPSLLCLRRGRFTTAMQLSVETRLVETRFRSPLRSVVQIREAVRSIDPDIIVVNDFYPLAWVSLAGAGVRRRVCRISHGSVGATGWNGVWPLLPVDLVICANDHMRAREERAWRWNAPTLVIPFPVDTARFSLNANRVYEVRARHELRPEQIVLGMVARVDPWKGHSLLLDAVDRLPSEQREKVVVAFAGDDSMFPGSGYLDALKRRAARSRVDTLFLGFMDPIEALLKLDVLVNPTLVPESLGLSVLEAMAMQRVVVCADEGGPRGIVRDGETGFLFTPRDADALTAALARVIRLPAPERTSMGARARDYVVRTHSVAAFTQRWESTLAGLIAAPSPA